MDTPTPAASAAAAPVRRMTRPVADILTVSDRTLVSAVAGRPFRPGAGPVPLLVAALVNLRLSQTFDDGRDITVADLRRLLPLDSSAIDALGRQILVAIDVLRLSDVDAVA